MQHSPFLHRQILYRPQGFPNSVKGLGGIGNFARGGGGGGLIEWWESEEK